LDFISNSSMFGLSIAVEHGKAIADIYSESENNSESNILALFNNFTEEDGNWGDPIISLLNGFCKVISELPKTVIVEGESKEESSITPEYDSYDWNAVPITKVVDFGNIENMKTCLSSMGNGSEKSPHWRRGHWRNIPLENGSFRRTWVKEAFIREDKLETENLAGSAVILKKKDAQNSLT